MDDQQVLLARSRQLTKSRMCYIFLLCLSLLSLSLLSGGGDGNIHLYDLDVSEREERRVIQSMADAHG